MRRASSFLVAAALLALMGALLVRDRARERQMDQILARLDHAPSAPSLELDPSTVAARVAMLLDQRTVAVPRATKETTAEAPAPARPRTATVEQERSIAVAQERAGAVIARGRITRDDVIELRRQLTGAAPDDAFELRRQLSVAINEQRLVPEDPHFMLP